MKEYLTSLYRRVFFNQFRRNLLQLTSGNAIIQLISILSYPVLTRLYPDEVFGQYALFNSIVILTSFAITLRYEVAIPLPRKQEEGHLLKRFVLILSLSLGISSYLLIMIIGKLNWLSTLGAYLYYLPVAFIAGSFIQIERYWRLRNDQMPKYFGLFGGYRLLYVAIAISLSITLIENSLITALTAASALLIVIILTRETKGLLSGWNMESLKKVLRDYRRFPGFALPSFIITHFTNQIPVFLITNYFSPGITGQYSVAYALLFLPQYLFTARLSESLYQNYRNEPPTHLYVIFFKIIRSVVLIMSPLSLLLIILSPALFPFVLGTEWHLAGEIAQVMALLMVTSAMASSVSSVVNILNLHNKIFWLSPIRFTATGVAFLYAGLTNDLFIGIKVFTISAILLDAAFVVMLFVGIKKAIS